MKRLAVPLLLVLALLAACGRNRTPPVELQVGAHRIAVVLPRDWEHVNYGDRHQLRRDGARISIEAFRRLNDDFYAAVAYRLGDLKEDARRDEASRRRFDVGGHEAVTVDTWDRLSHQFRKRFVFVAVGESLVGVYTLQGEFAAMAETVDALVASLTVVDSLPRPGVSGAVGGDQPE
jgi:hypothetical protein